MSWLTREILQRKHSTPAWLLQSARPLSPVTFPGSWSGKFSETASCAYYLFTKTTGKEAEHQTEAGDPLLCSTFPNVSFHQDTASGASFPWVPLSFSFFLILKNLQNIFSDMNMERGTNYPKPNFFFMEELKVFLEMYFGCTFCAELYLLFAMALRRKSTENLLPKQWL